MKKRNGTISFFKFLFIFLIMVYHCNDLRNGFDGGIPIKKAYLAVEFFFIVSGYYFAKSIVKKWNDESDIYLDNLKFIWAKLKRFLPYSLVATFLIIIVLKIYNAVSLTDILMSIYSVTFLSIFGFKNLVRTLWFISAMLAVMFIIYPIIRRKKMVYVYYISPLIILFGLGFLIQNYNCLDVHQVSWNHLFCVGLLRALVEINIGIVIAFFEPKINFMLSSMKLKYLNILISLVEVFLYAFVIGFILFYQKMNNLDYFVLIIMSLAIALSMSEKGVLNKIFSNKFIYYLEKISLPIYINHAVFVTFFDYYSLRHNISFYLNLSICCLTTIVFSILEYQIINYIKKRKLKS